MSTNDAHHAEYLGAIAGMQATYGTQKPVYAEGDFVSGMTAGRRWQGRIEWIADDRLTIDVGGAWLSVPASDVTH